MTLNKYPRCLTGVVQPRFKDITESRCLQCGYSGQTIDGNTVPKPKSNIRGPSFSSSARLEINQQNRDRYRAR
jgi:hypothetical protein